MNRTTGGSQLRKTCQQQEWSQAEDKGNHPLPLILEAHIRCETASGRGHCHQSAWSKWRSYTLSSVFIFSGISKSFYACAAWVVPDRWSCSHILPGIQASSTLKTASKAIYEMESLRERHNLRSHYFMKHGVTERRTQPVGGVDVNVHTEGPPNMTKPHGSGQQETPHQTVKINLTSYLLPRRWSNLLWLQCILSLSCHSAQGATKDIVWPPVNLLASPAVPLETFSEGDWVLSLCQQQVELLIVICGSR